MVLGVISATRSNSLSNLLRACIRLFIHYFVCLIFGRKEKQGEGEEERRAIRRRNAPGVLIRAGCLSACFCFLPGILGVPVKGGFGENGGNKTVLQPAGMKTKKEPIRKQTQWLYRYLQLN